MIRQWSLSNFSLLAARPVPADFDIVLEIFSDTVPDVTIALPCCHIHTIIP
jgi:hypothetical protein